MAHIPELHTTPPGLRLYGDFHRHVELLISVLFTIADEHRGAALDGENRRLLSTTLQAFAGAAVTHSADRDTSLLPRLRTVVDPRAVTLLDQLRGFQDDHRTAEDRRDAVDALGARWLRRGTLKAGEARALREHLAYLARLHRRHIEFEDRRLLPVLERILSAVELQAIQDELLGRRFVNQPPASGPSENLPD